jgi:hypothetical protein
MSRDLVKSAFSYIGGTKIWMQVVQGHRGTGKEKQRGVKTAAETPLAKYSSFASEVEVELRSK